MHTFTLKSYTLFEIIGDVTILTTEENKFVAHGIKGAMRSAVILVRSHGNVDHLSQFKQRENLVFFKQ